MNVQTQFVQTPVTPAESFFRYASELALRVPALQKPTLEEIRAKAPWVREIEHDISQDSAGFLRIGTILGEDEQNTIKGEEYKRRLSVIPYEFFGYQHADFLVRNQDEFPEFVKIFKEVYENEPVVYSRPCLDFLGVVVRDENGSQDVPHIAVSHDERLILGWTWLARGFRINGRIAIASQTAPIVVG